MKHLLLTAALVLLPLGTAQPSQRAHAKAVGVMPAAAPAAAVKIQSDALLSSLPHCDGIRVLHQPVTFAWPQIDKVIKKLKRADWGYYACPQVPAQVSKFYRERLPKPPYNQGETNWVVRREGTVGVYYSYVTQEWLYVWIVPQTGAQTTYVVVARSDGDYVQCRLRNRAHGHNVALARRGAAAECGKV